MKMAKVVNPSFHKAIMKLSQQDLPVKSSKAVLGILRKVKDETDEYHQQRIKLLTECSEKNEDGSPKLDSNENFVVAKEHSDRLNKELTEMMSRSVRFSKLKMSDLDDARLSAQELSLLEDLIS